MGAFKTLGIMEQEQENRDRKLGMSSPSPPSSNIVKPNTSQTQSETFKDDVTILEMFASDIDRENSKEMGLAECPSCGLQGGRTHGFVLFPDGNRAFCHESHKCFSMIEAYALKKGIINCLDGRDAGERRKVLDEEAYNQTMEEFKVEFGQERYDVLKRQLKCYVKKSVIQSFKEGEVNWIEDDDEFFNSWTKVKLYTKNILGDGNTYDLNDKVPPFKKIFLAHSKDTIVGKPQLILQQQFQLPLIKEMVDMTTETKTTQRGTVEMVEKIDVNRFKYVTFDEKVDGRVAGYKRDDMSLYYRIYRVIDKDAKAYLLFSDKLLPNCICEFKGMIISMDYVEELKKGFGMKSISQIFVMKEFIPNIKILSKEEIVDFTQKQQITLKDWRNVMDIHPNGNHNRFVDEHNDLRDAFVLSGKFDGYPLHIYEMGPPGTMKSMGDLETLDYKINEKSNIMDGGASRIKMLTPSFKDAIADLGYLLKCGGGRMGFIDESGKMAEGELNKHQTVVKNIFGECNPIYDCKPRTVGSGNNNGCDIEGTAKHIMVTNPISNTMDIYDHVGIIDATFLSRNLVWVQDVNEQNFIYSGNAVERTPHKICGEESVAKKKLSDMSLDELNDMAMNRINNNSVNIYNVTSPINPPTTLDYTCKELVTNKQTHTYIYLSVRGGIPFMSRDEFLTLFDTCNSFTCNIDLDKVYKIHNKITEKAKEPMKSKVWRPRGEHHVYLLVDGICKRRCLFVDYDKTFTPKQEDYDTAEKIVWRMVNAWNTDLSPKYGGGCGGVR